MARAEAQCQCKMAGFYCPFLEQTHSERTARNYQNCGLQLLDYYAAMYIGMCMSRPDEAVQVPHTKISATKDNGYMCRIAARWPERASGDTAEVR